MCSFDSSVCQWQILTVSPYASSFSAEPGKQESFSNSNPLTTPLPIARAGAGRELSAPDYDPDCMFPSLRYAPSLFLGPSPFCSQTPSSVHRAHRDGPLGAGMSPYLPQNLRRWHAVSPMRRHSTAPAWLEEAVWVWLITSCQIEERETDFLRL